MPSGCYTSFTLSQAGYGQASPEASGRGMVPRAVDQRSRFDRDLRHPHRDRGGEVQPGRLDDHDRGSRARGDPRSREPHLRGRGTRARRRAERHRAWRHQATPRHRGGPGARREDGARDPVRTDGPAEAVHSGAGRSRSFGSRDLPTRLGIQDPAHPARGHLRARTGGLFDASPITPSARQTPPSRPPSSCRLRKPNRSGSGYGPGGICGPSPRLRRPTNA